MNYTNKDNIPLPIAVMYIHDEYPHSVDPNLISVTTLLKPLKQLVMSRKATKVLGQEVSTDVSQRRASARGTALHNHMEAAWLSDSLPEYLIALGYPEHVVKNIKVNPEPEETGFKVFTEHRVNVPYRGYVISGEADFIIDGHVRDLKTTGVYTYIKGTKVEDYTMQLSLYRWLMQDIITRPTGAIDFIFMDWSVRESYSNKNYPKTPEMSMDIPLLSVEETTQWIDRRIDEINYFMDKDEEEIPSCSTDDLWAQPATFKYYNAKAVAAGMKRSTKNYTSITDAEAHLAKDGFGGHIAVQQMQVKFCKVCPAMGICKQATQYVKQGNLVL